MSPKEIVRTWIEAFNRGDAAALGRLYAENAINHQVAERPVEGRAAIKEMADFRPFAGAADAPKRRFSRALPLSL